MSRVNKHYNALSYENFAISFDNGETKIMKTETKNHRNDGYFGRSGDDRKVNAVAEKLGIEKTKSNYHWDKSYTDEHFTQIFDYIMNDEQYEYGKLMFVLENDTMLPYSV